MAGECGFFGKLPCRGDFVERRLDRKFCNGFDAWLQASILASKATLGDAWLPAYLEAPLWRFAIDAGVCGKPTTIGVMMPSVDRVGRYYPLTIAVHLAGPWATADLALSLDDWFSQLEDRLLAALEDDCTFEDFDAAVTAIALPNPKHTSQTAGANSLWWTVSPETKALRARGLPDAGAFTGFLVEDSTFFFEKKNQKTLAAWLRDDP